MRKASDVRRGWFDLRGVCNRRACPRETNWIRRWFYRAGGAVACVLAAAVLCAGCGGTAAVQQPLAVTSALLDVAIPLYAASLQEQGAAVDLDAVATYKQLILQVVAGEGFTLTPVPASYVNDPQFQIISPLTGKPCIFFTKAGPTQLGYDVLVMAQALLRERIGASQ